MTRRQGIKAIGFVLVLALCLGVANKLLFPFSKEDTNQSKTFYMEEENTVDVVVMGTSLMMMSFNPLRMYDQTGITAYNRACSACPPQLAYLIFEETLETQKPKVLAISGGALVIQYDYAHREGLVRRGIDYRKNSELKYEVVKDIVKQAKAQDPDSKQTVQSFYFPLLRYHSRWPEVIWYGPDDFTFKHDYRHGYYATFRTGDTPDTSEKSMQSTKKYHVDETTRYWYGKIIEECKANDIEVLIVGNQDMRWTPGKIECLTAYCEEMGIDFVDYNTPEMKAETGLNWKTDFYDHKHTNARGSLKFTDHLARYIKQKYNLEPSDVSDEYKAHLAKDIERFKKDCAKATEKGFEVIW
ncbi:MAG: hypothetical protein PUD55_07475 [Firmicutes bacterium]|nr:hypothetical protein [Bacillota bacterium]